MVDKVTKMAAELIFSVDAHISLTHSGGKPYECDQCKYSSKTAQNLKTHKQAKKLGVAVVLLANVFGLCALAFDIIYI